MCSTIIYVHCTWKQFMVMVGGCLSGLYAKLGACEQELPITA